MALKRIILDTNAYSAILKNDETICDYVSSNTLIGFSCFVIAELKFGFRLGKREEANLTNLKRFIEHLKLPVFQTTNQTIDHYIQIKEQLRKQGKPIPENDIWIAAQAEEYQCQVVTYDKHFENITGADYWPQNS